MVITLNKLDQGDDVMQRIKTLSQVYFRPEPIKNEASMYFQMYIITSQMARLKNVKENCLNQIDRADKRLEMLQDKQNSLLRLL